MSLKELVNNATTDKNTVHSYLDTYEELFRNKKDADVNILEVGIYNGGSIKLWRDYFAKGHVYGIDVIHRQHPLIQEPSILADPCITLYTETNAYNEEFVNSTLAPIKFDFLIDDGPHILESVQFFVKYYLPLLKDDGILIVEDVQNENWYELLKAEVPEKYHKHIKFVDLRSQKGRYDDLLFIVDLSMS